MYFVRSELELANAYEHALGRLPETVSFWVIYPKQKKNVKMSFNENDVRALGLASGFVDYRVCSVNAEWSGLKFARKKH